MSVLPEKVVTYKVVIGGLEGVSENVEALALMRAERRLDKAMKVIIDAIDRKLSHTGTGRIYPSRRTGGGKHQASAPGEPPSSDTYSLSTSFVYEIRRAGKRVLGEISSALWIVYGRRLELGGNGGGAYIAPRPYIRPAMAETDARVQKILDGHED